MADKPLDPKPVQTLLQPLPPQPDLYSKLYSTREPFTNFYGHLSKFPWNPVELVPDGTLATSHLGVSENRGP